MLLCGCSMWSRSTNKQGNAEQLTSVQFYTFSPKWPENQLMQLYVRGYGDTFTFTLGLFRDLWVEFVRLLHRDPLLMQPSPVCLWQECHWIQYQEVALLLSCTCLAVTSCLKAQKRRITGKCEEIKEDDWVRGLFSCSRKFTSHVKIFTALLFRHQTLQ